MKFILLLSALFAVTNAFTASSTSAQQKTFITTSSSSSSLAATTETTMVDEVKVGDRIPSIDLKEGQADYGSPVNVNIAELIKGKKVAIFAVPGAFTPGCSKSHLPSFIEAQEELKAKGVELTICIATNDAFVMEVRKDRGCFHSFFYLRYNIHNKCIFFSHPTKSYMVPKKQAWARTSGGTDAGIIFLSDSDTELTRALGLVIESDVMVRSKRYSLIADDGVVTHYFPADDGSADTYAPNVLASL